MQIKILNVRVLAENASGTVPLTECMEGRELTYTAIIPSWTSFSENIKYEFFFKNVKDISYALKYAKSSVVSINKIYVPAIRRYFLIVADDVINSPTASNHYFDSPVYVIATYKGATSKSTVLNIKVYELWIEYFRDYKNYPNEYKTNTDWMVCVGRNIDYKAMSSSDCYNFKWDLKSGTFYDYWQTTGGASKVGNDLVIPLSELNSARGDHFGDIYGNIRVQCKDGEGNEHYCESETMMSPSQKVKVFFPRDHMLTNSGSSGDCPAWFKFWAKNQGGQGMHL